MNFLGGLYFIIGYDIVYTFYILCRLSPHNTKNEDCSSIEITVILGLIMATNLIEPVTITSCNSDNRIVEARILKLSVTLDNLMNDAGTDNPIPLPNVDTQTLDKLIEYLQYHDDNPTEHTDYEGKGLDDIGPWDLKYSDGMNNALLFKVILASNYLDIKPLLHLTCKTVAKKIKGKKPAEIKEILKIENE